MKKKINDIDISKINKKKNILQNKNKLKMGSKEIKNNKSNDKKNKAIITKISKEKENELIDKLKIIYDKILKNDFSEKTEYLKITNWNYISNENKKILENLIEITNYYLISPIELLYKQKYEKNKNLTTEEDKCSICQFNFYCDEFEEENNKKIIPTFDKLVKTEINVVCLEKCIEHFFHIECINYLIKDKTSFKCPNCSIIYGILIGDMPKGTMKAYISKNLHCSGYNRVGTIVIDYNFPSGKRDKKNYSGTSRECYLPNTDEGIEILGLLKVAFDRKLTFTVGTSVTTGRTNTTVWNGIHHKTNLYGGPTQFGYPDDTYFNRVKEELAAKGVTKENIDEDLKKIADKLLSSN